MQTLLYFIIIKANFNDFIIVNVDDLIRNRKKRNIVALIL